MAWHKGKQIPLNNAMEIATWRQVLNKETTQMNHKTQREMDTMKGKLDMKNTYLHLFKNDDKLRRESVLQKSGKDTIFVYDQAKRDEEDHGGYC